MSPTLTKVVDYDVGLSAAGLNVLLGRDIVQDILPNETTAAKDYSRFKKRCLAKDYKLEFKKSEWTPDWFGGLQKQYRGVTAADEAKYGFIGQGEVRRQFAFGFSLMAPARRAHLYSIFVEDLKLNLMSNEYLLTALKELSDLAKHHGTALFGEDWAFFAETHLCFGAEPMTSSAAKRMMEQFRDWVYTPKEEDAEGSLRERIIMDGIDIFFGQLGSTEPASFDDFVAFPSRWLANGASDAPEHIPGAKKTKFASFAAASRKDLESRLLSESAPTYRFLEKRERGKIRNLVSGANDLNDQMAFLGMNLQEEVYKVASSSLSKDWSLDEWIKWSGNMHTELGVPVDQSTFDHVPSLRVLQHLINKLADKGAGSDPFAQRVARALKARFGRGVIHAELGEERLTLPHLRGVLSGWNWTGLIDTILNKAEFEGILKHLGLASTMATGKSAFQGDDVLFWVKSWSTALNIVYAYKEVLPVNPSKFFLDLQRVEYLRLVLTPNRRYGYFWRALPSILYANAWAGGKVTSAGIGSKWSLIHGRGATLARARDGCARDLAGHLRCTRGEALRLMATPVALGGLGMFSEDQRPLLTTAQGALAVKTPSVVEVGERRLQRGTFDSWTKVQRNIVIQNAATWFRDEWMADVGAKSIAAGIAMKKAPEEVREVLTAVEPLNHIEVMKVGWSHERSPEPLIDGLFLEEAVKKGMRERDIERICSLFAPRYKGIIKERWHKWARNVWVDWILGRLIPTIGRVWGDASDFNPWFKKKVEKTGLISCVPTHGYSRSAIRSRMCMIECKTARMESDIRTRFRG